MGDFRIVPGIHPMWPLRASWLMTMGSDFSGRYWLIPHGNTPDVVRQDREADTAVGLLPLQTGGTHSLVECRYSSGKSTRRFLDLENLCELFVRTDQRGT